jgi:hypothetical protein
MSINHHIYIGWYAEFERSSLIIDQGVVQHYFCTKGRNHPVKDKVCTLCNGKVKIEEEEEAISSRYPLSCQILGQVSQDVLDYLTGGRVSLKDLKELEGSMSVFPEFVEMNKEVIMAPGVKCYSHINRIKGFIEEVDIEQKPSEEWVNKIKYIFNTKDVAVKYGIIMEII